MEHSNVFGAEATSGGGGANLSNYYTKAETTALLSNKANLSAGKLATGEIPDLAITNVVTVSNNQQRNALTVEAGDVAIVSSTGLTWMWSGSAWVQIESTQVSWDNTVSSSGQTATAKFAAIDTALASAGSSVTVGNTVPSTSTTDALSANAIETNYLRKTNGNWQELGGMVGYNHTPNFNYANSTNVLVTRKYVDDNVGDMSFCGLSDVAPTTHSANKLTYSDGTNLQFTTTQIQINGGGIKTDQINPRQHQTTNLGDNTNRWNNVHCLALNAGTELVLPSTAGTANQVLSTDGQGTLSWVSQSSGGGAYLPTSEVHTVYRANDASTTQTYDCSYLNEGFLWHQARYLNKQTELHTVYRANNAQQYQTYDCSYINEGFLWHQARYDAKPDIDDTQVSSITVFSSNKTNNDYLKKTNTLQQNLNGLLQYDGFTPSFSTANQLVTKGYVDAQSGASIDDSQLSSSTVYSSTKIDATYFPRSLVFNSTRSSQIETYGCAFLNTQLANKMSSQVTDAQNTGGKFWTQSGGALTFKRLVGGTNVTVTENSTNITISAAGGSTADGVLNNIALNSNGTLSLSTSTPATFNASFAPVAVSGSYNDLTNKPIYNIPTLLASRTTNPTTDSGYRASFINTINGVTSTVLGADGNLAISTTGGNFLTTISSENLHWNVYSGTGDLPSASSKHGMFAHVHGTGKGYFAHNGNWVELANQASVSALENKTTHLSATTSPNTTTIGSPLNVNGELTLKPSSSSGLNPTSITTQHHSSTYNSLMINTYFGGNMTQMADFGAWSSSDAYPIKLNTSTEVTGSVKATTLLLNNGSSYPKVDMYTTANSTNSTCGDLEFWGQNSNSQTLTYASVFGAIGDPAAGAEHGWVGFSTMNQGSMLGTVVIGGYSSGVRYALNATGLVRASTGFVYPDTNTQTRAVTNPTTAGHILTANANGTWAWAAPVVPGGLSFTPNPIPAAYRGAQNRTSLITVLPGGWTAVGHPANAWGPNPIVNGTLGNESLTGFLSNYYAWKWSNENAYIFNEITIWTAAINSTGSHSDYFRNTYFQVWGSNDATTATNGTWYRLNEDNKWLDEAIAHKAYHWGQYNQNYPDGWTFKLHKNMNNYKCYRFKCSVSFPGTVYDITWKYNKSHEADYS